jgi:hypothetical protein
VSRPQIVERVQHPVAALRHERTPVEIHAADTFGRPVGVTAEQRVVVRRTKEANDAQLLHQLVPQFLGARLVQSTSLQVTFDVDIEEARDAADRHRRPVGLLDGAEVGEIGPLECLLGVHRGLRDVVTIELRHRCEVLQRTHLLRKFFAHADDLICRPHVVDLGSFLALDLQKAVGPVKGDPAIVTDDASATVGVRKAGDDAGPAAIHNLRRIGVEHAVIVRLAVLGEGFVYLRIGLETCCFQARFHHPQAAEREDRPLERLFRLKTDNHFVVGVDVASLVRQQRRRFLRVDGQNALFSFVGKVRLQLVPHRLGALRWRGKKFFVPRIGCDVADNEVAHVDRGRPAAWLESPPCVRLGILFKRCATLHDASLPSRRSWIQGQPAVAGYFVQAGGGSRRAA